MNKPRERNLARRIITGVAKNLRPFGHELTKPTFICREYPHLVAFFHFHKFTFGPRFRVHFGIRVLNSDVPAPHLNGPSFSAGQYRDDDRSMRDCMQTLTELLIREGLPWIDSWISPERLGSDSDTPLCEDDKVSLRSALASGPDADHVALSSSLLRLDRLTRRCSQPLTSKKITKVKLESRKLKGKLSPTSGG
jgi:hypothetical protein